MCDKNVRRDFDKTWSWMQDGKMRDEGGTAIISWLAGCTLGMDNARGGFCKTDKLMMFQQVHHKAPGDDRLTQGDWNILRLTAAI